MTAGRTARVEIWGGLECTANRVGDRTHSQLARNGHRYRIESDLDAFASLGLDALRYPILWEDAETNRGAFDFTDADRAMRHLAGGRMTPIAGLLHHGSGPRFTSLDDPDFATRFGAFAGTVAQRYPWVIDYTPINEPLTTARFSGLYGHWYPHARDDAAFVRMLLNQIRGTVHAMRAIREVTPAARLVQTEDLGRTDGTLAVRDQVRFENDRRWLTFDLLCGAVVPDHPLHDYILGTGAATPDDLRWFVDNRCTPDLLGLNHYPRSNRWLDHRTDLFEPAARGGNHSRRYADVAASDMPFGSTFGFTAAIEDSWRRYGIPIALTEVHVPGGDAERIGWWHAALQAADEARAHGVDLRAVTSWSLLGSYDWDTLCTTEGATVTYEPGAFDVSDGARSETLLADAIRRACRPTDATPARDGPRRGSWPGAGAAPAPTSRP